MVFGTCRQHSGWNFTRFQDQFHLSNILATNSLYHPEIRITLDTPEDYAVINIINSWLGSKANPDQIINFLQCNPHVANINSNVKAKQPGER
jgi:spore coat polysaccharide biosynthesis protein SpsF